MSQPVNHLHAIALERHTDPMNTWPQHEMRHRCTGAGVRTRDNDCLRCWLEETAGAMAIAAMHKRELARQEELARTDSDSAGRTHQCQTLEDIRTCPTCCIP